MKTNNNQSASTNLHKMTMKANLRTTAVSVLLILTASALLSMSGQAQTWQTVDDLTSTTYTNGITATCLAADASGGVYAAGYSGVITVGGRGLLRYSGDGGATWQTLDDFVYLSPSNTTWSTVYNAVHADAHGNLFVAGAATDAGTSTAFVRRSTDHGLTWTTVDDFLFNGSPPTAPFSVNYGLGSDSNGTLYAVGRISLESTLTNYWLIRVSADGGTSWQTSDPGLGGAAYSVVCVGTDVYVVGPVGTVGGRANWEVLRSSDRGASWAVVDSLISPSTNAVANAITSDNAGNLYAVGQVVEADGTDHWVVRQGQAGGTNWNTIDDYNLYDSIPCYAFGVAADRAGNVYVAGRSGPTTDWLVRWLSAASGQWTTSDDFNLTYVEPHSAVCDSSGNVFVAGRGFDSNNIEHWLVRKLASSQPPALQVTAAGYSLSISWPAAATGYTLEASDTLGPAANWSAFPAAPQVVGDQYVVTLDMTNSAQFFRLSQ